MLKRLIVNADDFGFTRDVNAGIIKAHREGILTATTLMANGTAFEDAVQLARETPSLDIGCHLVLVQGRAISDGRPFASSLKGAIADLVWRRVNPYWEMKAQIEKILAAGIRPSHLDTHKHLHLAPAVFAAVVKLAAEYSIPFVRLPLDMTTPYAGWACRAADPLYRRAASRRGVQMTDYFLGYRRTGWLYEESLMKVIQQLPEGTTEFMCHPGMLGDELLAAPTRLKESRGRELEALTSPRVRAAMDAAGVRLAAFDSGTQTLMGR